MTQRRIDQATETPRRTGPEPAAAADDVGTGHDHGGTVETAAELTGSEANDEYEEL